MPEGSSSSSTAPPDLPDYECPPSPPPLEDLIVGTNRYETPDPELPAWSERLPDVDNE